MIFTNNNKIFDPNLEKKYNPVFERYMNYDDILDCLLHIDCELEAAFDHKYAIIDFYKKATFDTARAKLDDIIIDLKSCPIPEMSKFANTLSKWKYEIVNSFTPANGRRISNGLIENRNKFIKLLKHSSNGYLNWERFRTRILFSLNNDSTYHLYPIKNKGDFTYERK